MTGPTSWMARPVNEFDATADKCFFDFFPEGDPMCGHSTGDDECLRTRYHAGDPVAIEAAQLALFGEATA